MWPAVRQKDCNSSKCVSMRKSLIRSGTVKPLNSFNRLGTTLIWYWPGYLFTIFINIYIAPKNYGGGFVLLVDDCNYTGNDSDVA